MLKHILLVIFRDFKRFKNSFFINLIGLTTGLICSLLIYLWVSDELNFDKFHEKDARLFQVLQNKKSDGNTGTMEYTPGLLGEVLVREMPEVQYAAASAPGSWFGSHTLSFGDTYLKARGQFADKDFFNIFSFNLREGDKSRVLSDKRNIVLSRDLAQKLFHSTENVIGKTVIWHWQMVNEPYIVSGIFEGTPVNSSLQFDFILPWKILLDKFPNFLDWGNSAPQTYVVLKKGKDLESFNKKIAGLIPARTSASNGVLFARRFSDGYLYGQYVNGRQTGGRIEYVRLISIIAVFILVIACINFMNLSTAKASRRLKDVGIKKALGAGRKMLILQYLGESTLMTLISLIIAVVITLLLLPQFNLITGKQLRFSPGPGLIMFTLAIVLLTGLIAGSYPAIYLSGFSPVAVLKGKIHTSISELWARKGLVIFQFMLSVILIVSVLVVYKQIEYVQGNNAGYNKDNIIYFGKEGRISESQENFLSELKNIPGVINASSINENIVGTLNTTDGLSWQGKNPKENPSFSDVGVNYDMIETLGIKMKEGRSFSKTFDTDTSAIIFNEAAIDVMELKNPVGQNIVLWGRTRHIIGVTKNFHFQSFHETVKPLLFRLAQGESTKIMVKIAAGKERETIGRLEDFYHTYNPGYIMDYKFLDQDYQEQYAAETRVAILSRYFACFAILISCLGLFGMVSFTAERRIKEIGIRKVLGSSSFGIVLLLSKDFTRMVIISILIALPISYVIVKNWLNSFAYRIGLEPWFFLEAGLLTLLIAWLTICVQTIKAANTNPIQCLRDE
jgi:putative ABC transport system permease protein